MKYQISMCGRNVVLTEAQLETLITAVQDADHLSEKYVGSGAGSQGSGNNYVPVIERKLLHDWLQVQVMQDDYVDAVKLSMKLIPSDKNF
jgi:hypothetical protein